MRKHLLTTCVGAVAAFCAGSANANDELIKMSQNPKQWVMPTGDYANTRYSKLRSDQRRECRATCSRPGRSRRAFCAATKAAPLVIGDVMYVHTPFPNIVYALDLNNDGKILWKYEPKQDPNVIPVMCCDTVNRGLAYGDGKIFLHQADTTLVALDAKTGKVVWSVKNGDPEQGRDRHFGADSRQGQGSRRHLGRRVRRPRLVTAYDIEDGQAGLARLFDGAGQRHADGSGQRRPISASRSAPDSGIKTWQGDQWKIGGGTTWGWYSYDPTAQPGVLRVGQSLDLEPEAASRRQQVVDDDLGPRRRYRHGAMGLPDDPA